MASAPDALPQALSSDDAPAQAAPSDASALLKAALAKKNQAQLYPAVADQVAVAGGGEGGGAGKQRQ